MDRGFCSIVLLGIVYVVSNVLGCSVLEPGARAIETGHEFETDDRKVYYTDVVVYGEVVGKVEGDYPFKGISGVHTVEFKVLCTYKGGPVPKTIYIAGMGNENGQIKACPAAQLRMETMVMFLKQTKMRDVFEIEFSPNYGDESILLDDLTLTCGLTLTDDREEICRDFEPLSLEDGCIAWTPIVIEPEVTKKPTPKRKPEPKVTLKSEGEYSQPESTNEETDDSVVIIEGDKNTSGKGYEQEPETDKHIGSTSDGNESPIYKASFVLNSVTILLSLVV